MTRKKKKIEVVDLTSMKYPESDIIQIEEVKEENEEKQEEIKVIEDSEKIYGILEG